MVNPELNPLKIAAPQGLAEKARAVISKNVPTAELVERLKAMDTDLTFDPGAPGITIEAIGAYIQHDFKFCNRAWSRTAIHNANVQRTIDRSIRMKQQYDSRAYLPLVKMFVTLAAEEWKKAESFDEIVKDMSFEERTLLETTAAKNDKIMEKLREKKKQDPDYNLESDTATPLFDIRTNPYRRQSEVFLRFAVVLARSVN